MIVLREVQSNILAPQTFCFIDRKSLKKPLLKKNIYVVSEIKWWITQISQASTHPGQDPKKKASSLTGSLLPENGLI